MITQQTNAQRTLCDGDEQDTTNSLRSAVNRRQLLRSVGGMIVIGSAAGCIGNTTQNSDGDTNSDGATSVDEWLSNTGNYESIQDLTGKTSIQVEVGAQGNAGRNAFAPAAIRISPETAVTWTWVDGYHNVVAEGGEFNSGSAEQNATFKHVFESPGTYLYSCIPHESIGMKGAVVVKEPTDGAES